MQSASWPSTMTTTEDEVDAGSFSSISCGPHSMAPKVLVGIIKLEQVNQKTVYELRCMLVASEFEWTVKRRYSEFLAIRDELEAFFARAMVNQCFGCRWFSQSLRGFEFPRKHLLLSRDPLNIRRRKHGLDNFARLIAAHTFSAIPKCVKCSKAPFTKVRDFFLRDARFPVYLNPKQIRAHLIPEAFAPISDPSKSKIEFRRGHGILKILQVEKPVFSKRLEQEAAVRQYELQKLLERQLSASMMSVQEHQDNNAEFKAPVPSNAATVKKDDNPEQEQEDEDELDMTGITTDTEATAQHLAPLRAQAPTPRELWEPWEFAPPMAVAVK